MVNYRMRAYVNLSRWLFAESYLGKILLAAFVGTHLPLLVLIFYLFFVAGVGFGEALTIVAVALLATVLGSVLTLSALYVLLTPVSLSSRALRSYLERAVLPELPTDIDDEAGKLLADVQRTVTHLDTVIHSLEELSTRDGLTGVYNRRASEERLAEEVARVRRGEESLTIAALDTDKLKEVNDRHGHDAGDACLKHLVSTVEQNIRQSDWLGRWGGDEFVVVLWDAEDPRSARAIVERIADDLKETPARLPRGAREVTLIMSGGIASHRHEEGARELFSRADEALLEAKRRGRGIIVDAA